MLISASPICAAGATGPTGCSVFSRAFMKRKEIQVAMAKRVSEPTPVPIP